MDWHKGGLSLNLRLDGGEVEGKRGRRAGGGEQLTSVAIASS